MLPRRGELALREIPLQASVMAVAWVDRNSPGTMHSTRRNGAGWVYTFVRPPPTWKSSARAGASQSSVPCSAREGQKLRQEFERRRLHIVCAHSSTGCDEALASISKSRRGFPGEHRLSKRLRPWIFSPLVYVRRSTRALPRVPREQRPCLRASRELCPTSQRSPRPTRPPVVQPHRHCLLCTRQ
jgi:hypothetical protein